MYLQLTTPITAMGCHQCLPLSVVQLKGKHCRKPHCRKWGCRYVRALYSLSNFSAFFLWSPLETMNRKPLNLFVTGFSHLEPLCGRDRSLNPPTTSPPPRTFEMQQRGYFLFQGRPDFLCLFWP